MGMTKTLACFSAPRTLLYFPRHLANSFEFAKKIKSNYKHYLLHITSHASQISVFCEINTFKLKTGHPISVWRMEEFKDKTFAKKRQKIATH